MRSHIKGEQRGHLGLTQPPGLLKPGEYRRDRHRMGDVRMTAEAPLALMAPCRYIARMPEQLDIGAWPKCQDYLAEFLDQMAPGSICA
jgi:hypothetical protein